MYFFCNFVENMKRHLLTYLVIVLILSACGGHAGDDRPVLAVSIEPQRWLLEQIAGDDYSVVTVLTPGSNPETFEPSMSQRAKLEKADAYFTIGSMPFEQTLAGSLSHPQLYSSGEGIDFIYGTHGAHDGHRHDGAGYDPHVWTSVRNARLIAANMYRQLCRLNPDKAAGFKQRYEALDTRLDSLDQALTGRLARARGTTFMVWHPSLSYFARDYGLNQLSVGWEAKEVSPAALRSVIDHAKADGVKVFFHQREFDSRQAQSVNSQLGTRMVTIDPLGYDWEKQINLIADELSR